MGPLVELFIRYELPDRRFDVQAGVNIFARDGAWIHPMVLGVFSLRTYVMLRPGAVALALVLICLVASAAGFRWKARSSSLRPLSSRTEMSAGALDYGRKVTLMVIRVSTSTPCSNVGS